MNVKPILGKSLIAGTALLTAVATSSGKALANEANVLVKPATAITETLVKQVPQAFKPAVADQFVKIHLEQKETLGQKQAQEGWLDKLLQWGHCGWDKVTSNRCCNTRVEEVLNKTPITKETLKEGAEAVTFNQTCQDVSREVVVSGVALGAGAATGALGAAPVYAGISGAVIKPLIKGTNDANYTFGKGVYDTATGYGLGYGGAHITYKAPVKAVTTHTTLPPIEGDGTIVPIILD